MKRSLIETILGAVVLVVAIGFLTFSYSSSDMAHMDGYDIVADFSGIGGLQAGDDVQISGVKVGTVKNVALNEGSYLARVTISVDDNIKLPIDTAALISSESLLGGRYLALEPGADDEMMKPGDRVEFTQAPQNLEQLLGQFIFSMNDAKDEKKEATAAATPTPAAPRASAAPQTQAQPVADEAPE